MVRQKVDYMLEYLLIILMWLMVVDVVWQVASRYLLGAPSVFTDELAGFLLIWVGLFGAAYASGKGQHLAIDILPQKLSAKNKVKLDRFINLLIILFALTVMVIGGSNLVYLTFILEQRSASLGVPLGFVYITVPISGILIVYYSLDNILKHSKA